MFVDVTGLMVGSATKEMMYMIYITEIMLTAMPMALPILKGPYTIGRFRSFAMSRKRIGGKYEM